MLILKERLPYYMAYPMPFPYEDERIERRDVEYLKSMYPMTVKRILPYVEAECDRMAYAGSVIYDEYPDQLQIRLMCNRIYEKVQQNMEQGMEMQASKTDDRLRELVQILVFQELYHRRCQHRRDRKKYFY